MEGLKIANLFEEVLSGKSEDPQKHKESIKQLHQSLASNQSNQKLAQSLLQSFKTRLQPIDFVKFSNYLQSFSQGRIPEMPTLGHLLIATESACKTAKLLHAVHSLEMKQMAHACVAFNRITSYKPGLSLSLADLESKKLNCLKLISNLKSALGKNMQKTVSLWHERENTKKPQTSLRGLERKATLSNYDKKSKVLNILIRLIKVSPIIEQTSFWRWKYSVQAMKGKENRLKHATKLSEYILKLRHKKEGFSGLYKNSRPKWEIFQAKLKKTLRNAELRYFYLKNLILAKIGSKPKELAEKPPESETSKKTAGLKKGHQEVLRSKKPSDQLKPETKKNESDSQRGSTSRSGTSKGPSKITDTLEAPDLYKHTLLRSIFKYSSNRSRVFLKKWATLTGAKEYEMKKLKLSKLLEVLKKALKTNTKICYSPPSEPKTRETILTNALLAICKNIIFVKSRLFSKWMRCPNSKMKKLDAFLIRNLGKFPKMALLIGFTKWKVYEKAVDPTKMLAMISTLQRIFANKGKRVFHPPYIVKNADEIMIRTIKKIRAKIRSLYDSAFTRWHFYKIACYTKEKACVFYRACQQAANPMKNAFAWWKEIIHSKIVVFRTTARTSWLKFLINALGRGSS